MNSRLTVGTAVMLAFNAMTLCAQISPFRGIWWKLCDQDIRYDSAYDPAHSYGKDSPIGGWRIEEVTRFAEKGDACMQSILGGLYSHEVMPSTSIDLIPLNWKQSARWFLLAAHQGHGDAQVRVAGYYWSGRGMRQDYLEAAKWFLKAAEQGLPCAQFQLGELYRDGQGVEQDDVQA